MTVSKSKFRPKLAQLLFSTLVKKQNFNVCSNFIFDAFTRHQNASAKLSQRWHCTRVSFSQILSNHLRQLTKSVFKSLTVILEVPFHASSSKTARLIVNARALAKDVSFRNGVDLYFY
ncbi:hypothetical protein N8500_11020 [Candidatus Puniceispirillum sp.]|nr:hypothetical protein [Candidatus Puniceispirillum sp.]